MGKDYEQHVHAKTQKQEIALGGVGVGGREKVDSSVFLLLDLKKVSSMEEVKYTQRHKCYVTEKSIGVHN